MGKRGQITIDKQTIVNTIIIVFVVFLVGILIYSILSGKATSAIEYLKNLLRFGR